MNELALFAGVGGGMLGGTLLGWRTICAVENNGFCREVLMRRQDDGLLSPFPIWNDVRTFRQDNPECQAAIENLNHMDDLIVTAGFPCQPYSSAGKGRGEDDPRNLWPDTMRIVREVGPRFVLLENVPGLLRFDYFGRILGELAEAGYDAEWDVVSAAEVGALHLRKRLWVFAWPTANSMFTGKFNDFGHGRRDDPSPGDGGWWDADPAEVVDTHETGRAGEKQPEIGRRRRNSGGKKAEILSRRKKRKNKISDSTGIGFLVDEERRRNSGKVVWKEKVEGRESGNGLAISRCNCWGIESGLGRVADGVADRVDRLAAIGNGQVPLVAAVAFLRLACRAGFCLRS